MSRSATAADLLERFVTGENAVPPQALWRRLAGSLNRLGRGTGYLAIAAIDVAAWDLHAKAQGVPPYVVFHDASLIDMAVTKPRSLEEFAAITGVGKAKLTRYGEDFLLIIASYARG